MIDTIITLLEQLNIGTWKIMEESVSSRELFFIRKDLDMNRAKKLRTYTLTLYRDFNQNCETYRGSASIKLSPSMGGEEIKDKIEKAFFAASFVKNPYYPLPEPSSDRPAEIKSQLDTNSPLPLLKNLISALYRSDKPGKNGINSAELFISSRRYRLINSQGVDVSFNQFRGDLDFITEWNEEDEAVELHNMLSFSDYCPGMIEEESRIQIENCRLRALAKKAPDLKNLNIIISGEAVKEMMGFYLSHGSSRFKYEGLSKAEPGKVFQGDQIKGDSVTISLNPALENSPFSAPYDDDGVPLKSFVLFKKGVFNQYHGSTRYAHYLGIDPSGTILNSEVASGSGKLEELKKEPHVEILTFSDFQMDELTGDFGGEVRLALYYDGKTTTPLTGASLSANILEIQNEFYLSREIVQYGSYKGPRSLLFPRGHLAGSRNSGE